MYPEQLFANLELPVKRYERLQPQADWPRLREPHARWQKSYHETTLRLSGGYILSLLDGGLFLRIEDFRDGDAKVYVLEGLAREVMLAVEQVQSFAGICRLFPDEAPESIQAILRDLAAIELVYQEDHLFLGLPIRQRQRQVEE